MKTQVTSAITAAAVTLLLATTVTGCGQNQTRSTAKGAVAAQQVVVVHRATGSPKLDGRASEAFWTNIKATNVRVSDGRVAQIKAAYSGDNIFVSVVWPGIPESGALRQWEFDGSVWNKKFG